MGVSGIKLGLAACTIIALHAVLSSFLKHYLICYITQVLKFDYCSYTCINVVAYFLLMFDFLVFVFITLSYFPQHKSRKIKFYSTLLFENSNLAES